MNKKNILTQIAKKHVELNNPDYLDKKKVNQEKSFHVKSRLNTYGSGLIFQYVEMFDGSIYLLISESASMKGILANKCKGYGVTRKEVKDVAKSFDMNEKSFIKY